MKFYYGAASWHSRKALEQLETDHVMINYATAQNEPWDNIPNLFVDSGGYSFMRSNKGSYETSEKEYLKFIEKHQPEHFALRDYPCEPDLLERFNRDVKLHQEMTCEAHAKLLGLMEEYSIEGQPVSVVQGWKLEDYIEHIEMMKEQDLLTDYVAIGSVCRRNQDQKIRRIIKQVSKRIGDRKLHAFGVKTNVLRFPDVVRRLDSADSMAYEYNTRTRLRTQEKRTRNWRDVAFDYLKMRDRIEEALNSNPNKQKTLPLK